MSFGGGSAPTVEWSVEARGCGMRVQKVKVAIVGAAFSGLDMAARLKRAGIDSFVVLEKESDLGGVWRDNHYPGCSCDVPSHLYSFSFAPYRNPAVRYPEQRDILGYLHDVAEREKLLPHLRLSAEVTRATYQAGRWTVATGSGDRYEADYLVWAVGQLHRPYLPDIEGRNTFRGTAFHTARWDHSHDLRGRRVAVVGTGSSATQLVPEIARTAAHVTVYQRTPHWVLPRPAKRFRAATRWALTALPILHHVYRAALYRGADSVLAPVMTRGWSARPAEALARAYLRLRVRDRQLRAAVTPGYPLGGKRIVLSNKWFQALSEDNVELVTAPIRRVTPAGIEAADRHRDADTIVWATGFRATEFLVPATVTGRDGADLHTVWASGAYAYLGLAVPRFPNMFLIAGPGSFLASGSNPGMHECQADYILRAIELGEQPGMNGVEVDAHVMATYQKRLEAALARTVWTDVPSWYRTPAGQVVNPWPGTARQFARLTRQDPAAAFNAVPRHPRTVRAGQRVRLGHHRSRVNL